jgi:carboxylesterase type B
MPAHTFTRVGLWEESIEANLRSRRSALAANSIAEALHASDYAMYAYLQLGKYPEAKAILEGLPALAEKFDVNAITGAAPGSAGVFALAAIPARWALERRNWAEAAALEPKASGFPYTEAMTYFTIALGAAHTGDLTKARAAIDSLAEIRDRLTEQNEAYWAEQVAIQHLAARAWLQFAEKRDSSALDLMREATKREDATEKAAVTPGPLAPARELLADMLTELNRATDARAEYQAVLEREPKRRHSLVQLGQLTRE